MATTDLPIQIYRGLASCLTPEIDLTLEGGDRIPDQVRATFAIQGWIDKLISGQINDDEFIQAIEPYIGLWGTIDQYIAEIAENLNIKCGLR